MRGHVEQNGASIHPVRTAVVGLGRAGWNIHAKALRAASEHFIVDAVCDPDEERRAEAGSETSWRVESDFQRIIDDDQIELVVVASPSHVHTQQTIAALEAGKHVVCEKPFALSAQDAGAMLDAAHRADLVLAPFQNRRYEPHYQKVLEIVHSGALGEVLQIRMCWHKFSRRWDWQAMRKFGGGALFNNGTHLLDQALGLLGDGEPDIFLDLRRGLSLGDADEHMKLVLRRPDGPTIDIELTNASAFEQDRWHIMGTAGGLIGTTEHLQWKTVDWATMPDRELDLGPAEGRRYPAETFSWELHEWRHPEGIPTPPAMFYSDVYGAIRTGSALTVTPESAYRYVQILDRCREQFAGIH
ncbi:MAG: Gfo/Idh/MocA family oxidoreductase [Planctomycetota bacterium]